MVEYKIECQPYTFYSRVSSIDDIEFEIRFVLRKIDILNRNNGNSKKKFF